MCVTVKICPASEAEKYHAVKKEICQRILRGERIMLRVSKRKVKARVTAIDDFAETLQLSFGTLLKFFVNMGN